MKKYVVLLLALFIACSGQEKKEEKTEEALIKPKAAVEEKIEYARTEAGNPIEHGCTHHSTIPSFHRSTVP